MLHAFSRRPALDRFAAALAAPALAAPASPPVVARRPGDAPVPAHLRPHAGGRELRREIAAAEGVSRERLSQIVRRATSGRDEDDQPSHRRMQIARLTPALRLAAAGVAKGDARSIPLRCCSSSTGSTAIPKFPQIFPIAGVRGNRRPARAPDRVAAGARRRKTRRPRPRARAQARPRHGGRGGPRRRAPRPTPPPRTRNPLKTLKTTMGGYSAKFTPMTSRRRSSGAGAAPPRLGAGAAQPAAGSMARSDEITAVDRDAEPQRGEAIRRPKVGRPALPGAWRRCDRESRQGARIVEIAGSIAGRPRPIFRVPLRRRHRIAALGPRGRGRISPPGR